MSTFLPLALNVRDKRCVVVGGGRIGTRKALTLAGAGANVTVVSPATTAELDERTTAGEVRHVRGTFKSEHLEGALLVVAATDDEAVNAAVVRAACGCGVLACDASSAERSDVIFGAIHRANGVTIAVFTDGRDPGRAAKTRDRMADLLAADGGGNGGEPSGEG